MSSVQKWEKDQSSQPALIIRKPMTIELTQQNNSRSHGLSDFTYKSRLLRMTVLWGRWLKSWWKLLTCESGNVIRQPWRHYGLFFCHHRISFFWSAN
jgi:hypothetical protein